MTDDVLKTYPPEFAEYPRILYRPGGSEDAWRVQVDTLIVNDDDELAEAMSDGWTLTPNGNAEPKAFSLLDESVASIIEHLPALTADELAKLRADEQAGKTRKSVLGAIDKAVAALDAPPPVEPPVE